MIEYHLPSKRKAPAIPVLGMSPPWTPTKAANDTKEKEPENTSFVFEKLRRDKIVRDAYSKCPWKPGDLVMPHSIDDQKKYGRKCTVTSVARNLIEYGDSDWPKTDNPLIVLVKIDGKNSSFFCTPSYLIKYEEEKETQ